MANHLNEAAADWKDELLGVDLSFPCLQGAGPDEASLQKAKLNGAHLDRSLCDLRVFTQFWG